MKKYIPVLFVVCLIFTACVPDGAGVTISGSWKLTSYGPLNSLAPAAPNVDAILTFDDGELSGNAGCNSLMGDYKIKGDQIVFGSIASTEMGCLESQVMEQENIAHQVLTGTASFKIEGNMLTITNQNMLLVFESVRE
jgi:heat shock protein HslJ